MTLIMYDDDDKDNDEYKYVCNNCELEVYNSVNNHGGYNNWQG